MVALAVTRRPKRHLPRRGGMATKEPYSFLYVDNTRQVRERYFVRFEERLLIDEVHVDESKEPENQGEIQSFDPDAD